MLETETDSLPVHIALVEPGCRLLFGAQDDPPAVRSARVTLWDVAGGNQAQQESPCVELDGSADLTAVQAALHQAGIAFNNLVDEEVAIKLAGFGEPGCQSPLTRCGQRQLRLGAANKESQPSIELPLYCWTDGDAVAYNLCVDGLANRVVDAHMEAATWQSAAATGSPHLDVSSDVVRSGRHSLLIRNQGSTGNAKASWSSAMFTVEPEQPYMLAVWAYVHGFAETGGSIDLTLQISWYNNGPQHIGTARASLSNPAQSTWEQLKTQEVSPDSAAFAQIQLMAEMEGTGEVWFDDAELY